VVEIPYPADDRLARRDRLHEVAEADALNASADHEALARAHGAADEARYDNIRVGLNPAQLAGYGGPKPVGAYRRRARRRTIRVLARQLTPSAVHGPCLTIHRFH